MLTHRRGEPLERRIGRSWTRATASSGGPADRIPFAELAEAAAGLDLPEHLPIRGGVDNRLTGQSLPRLDVPVEDRRLGPLRRRRPAARHGLCGGSLRARRGAASPASNSAAAERVPGTLKIVRNPEWVAVAATNWWAAATALDAIRPALPPAGRARRTAARSARALNAALDSGDAGPDFRERRHGFGLSRRQPDRGRATRSASRPSAPIEPLTATARVTGDRLEIWAPTQAPGLARAAAARALGLAEDQVTLYPTLAGGGYGRKLEMDAIEQAAILALRMGRPVQLTWPRIQEIERDTFRPAAAAQLTGWLQQGRLDGLAGADRRAGDRAPRSPRGSAPAAG